MISSPVSKRWLILRRTDGSNPFPSSAESANYRFRSRQAASAVFPNRSTRFTSPIGRLTGSTLSFSGVRPGSAISQGPRGWRGRGEQVGERRSDRPISPRSGIGRRAIGYARAGREGAGPASDSRDRDLGETVDALCGAAEQLRFVFGRVARGQAFERVPQDGIARTDFDSLGLAGLH
jgi:hypothetical protein